MRMHPVFQIIVLLVCVLFSVPAMSDGHDKAQIQTVNVADGIYMLVGSGGNIGVSAGDDGVLIIDDQFEAMNEKIRAAIADVTDQPVKMLLNTHWHGDHTGGNQSFAKTGALIIAHNNVRTRMSTEHFSEFFNMQVEPSPAAALPVVTFDSGVTL
ncbi:MAG: MBL fold metallo-hydrolase, partial [Gammaproteobacteria bacterium]|nr:MBL fold metallo-hydrolase [Gammaproteobacteria bacterium]